MKLGWNMTLTGHGREAPSVELEADVVGVLGGATPQTSTATRPREAQDATDGSLNRRGGHKSLRRSFSS